MLEPPRKGLKKVRLKILVEKDFFAHRASKWVKNKIGPAGYETHVGCPAWLGKRLG